MLVEDDDEESEERAAAEEFIGVWEENILTLQIFVAVETQWLRAGMDGARVGINYEAVRGELRDRGVLDHQPYIEEIRVMEMGAMEVFAEQARKRSERMRREARRRARGET